MKKTNPFISLAAATLLLVGCSENETPKSELQNEKLTQTETHTSCGYIDQYWGQNAQLTSTIVNASETNFINNQNAKIANVFGISTVPLYFASGSGTFNAISYGSGYIIFGEQLYNNALNYGRIACAMVQAHEVAHQLQFRFNLPSRVENTARAGELEADGFAGYYIRKPNGYNASWSTAATAYNYSATLGDNNVNSPNHHGTAGQRRSAFRLGWLLGEYDLSVSDLDYNFFYYYNNYVLPGNLRKEIKKPADIKSEIHDMIVSKLEELRKISSGEIAEEEFTKL